MTKRLWQHVVPHVVVTGRLPRQGLISLPTNHTISASTLLVEQPEGHPVCKNLGVGLLVVTI